MQNKIIASTMASHRKICKRFAFLLFFFVLAYIILNASDFGDLVWTCLVDGQCQSKILNKYNEPSKKERFVTEWCRQRRARVDWKSFLAPCRDNMAWGVTKEGWGKENATDPIMSYISMFNIRPAGEFSKFSIQSQTSAGRPKTIGGDAWRVHMIGPSGIAPTVFDHGNGTYEVLFLALEPGVYIVEIMLDYSLCSGMRDPPDNWFIVGTAQGKSQINTQVKGNKDFMLAKLWDTAPFNVNIPQSFTGLSADGTLSRPYQWLLTQRTCDVKCNFLWDGYGRWVEHEWRPYLKGHPKLKFSRTQGEGMLWIYGDSLGVFFADSLKTREFCHSSFRRCDSKYNWVYPITKEQIANGGRTRYDRKDFNQEKILNAFREVVHSPEMDSNGAVVFNFGLHYVESTNFSNYQKLVDGLIGVLKEQKSVNGSLRLKTKAPVIWKTTTAINKQKAVLSLHMEQKRFLTYQRVLLYNAYATAAMCEAGIDVLDVYPLTDSHPKGTGYHGSRFALNDVVHYNNSVFWPVENLLEEYFGRYKNHFLRGKRKEH